MVPLSTGHTGTVHAGDVDGSSGAPACATARGRDWAVGEHLLWLPSSPRASEEEQGLTELPYNRQSTVRS